MTTAIDAGSPAPGFTAPTNDGGSLSLDSLRGKAVVLYFYPRDDTPGCTREAQEFTEALPQFAAAGAEIVGVSKDSAAKHDKFREKYGLPFTLVSDAESDICERYGVWVEKKNLRQDLHGHRALDLPHRRRRHRQQGLAQGEGPGPRRQGARGGAGAQRSRRLTCRPLRHVQTRQDSVAMSEAIKSKWGTIGTVACGQNAIGLVSAGLWNAIGLVAVGLINAMGLVCIAPGNAMGFVAIGGGNAMGVVAIGGGNAMGIVALAGGTATGVIAIAGGSSRSAIPI